MPALPQINFDFFKRLLLGLLIIAAGAIIAAFMLLIPKIGISIIGGILGLWVVYLSYQLGNALLRPSVWQREAFQQPSDYIRKLTRDYDHNPQFKRPWFYPGEFIDAPLTTERLEQERIENRETTFEDMRFDLDKIISEAQKRAIPADAGIREIPPTKPVEHLYDGLTSDEAWALEKAFEEKRQSIRWDDDDETKDESESH